MLIIIGLAVVLYGLFDIFERWYTLYLKRLSIPAYLIRLIQRLKWVVMAFIFWEALVARQMVAELSVSHLLFSLFIFSLFRLIVTLYPGKNVNPREDT